MSILFDNVSVSYGSKRILDSLNVTIEKGSFVAIMGSNGSGKSTFAYCCNGIIPHAVGAKLTGNITINGINTKNEQVGTLSKQVGLVFQDPSLVLFNATVEEEVLFGIRNLRLDKELERAHDALTQVGLESLKDNNPQELSEGQKQKLCIATVLAMGTEYIVLDEPISHLNYSNAQIIYSLLHSLHEHGKTIIVIEHHTKYVSEFTKQCILLKDGSIIADGQSKTICKDSKLLQSCGIAPL